MLKSFLKDESGMGTIEIVVIIAILVGLALIFRDGITNYVNNLMDKIWDTDPGATDGMKYEKKTPQGDIVIATVLIMEVFSGSNDNTYRSAYTGGMY